MTIEVEKLAEQRVLKARAELIASRVFYGTLVANVKPLASRKFPTMATNGCHHFYNPEFIAGLTQKQVLGVQAHETEHDARHHHTRRAWRDPKEWNICCDLAINPDLLAEGFELPPGALFESRFAGMSAEDIYRCRELDRAGKSDEDEQDDADGQDGADENDDNGGNSPPDDNGENEADGTGTGGENAGTGGKPNEEADQKADFRELGGPGSEIPPAGEEDAAETASPTSGDPGGCGEVLDSGSDAAEIAEQDARWEVITRQAVALSKRAGDLPGYMTREIERMNAGKQDWREVLRAWIDQGSKRTSTWNKPNRRFVGQGLLLPGSQPDGINKVVFLIDTSGSMDQVALQCVADEAQAALDDGAIDDVIVVYGDTRVTKVDQYCSDDEIKFDPRGGGGTDLRPMFNWVRDNADDASLIVCFTDLYIGDPGPEPQVPVLFAVTGYPQMVRALIEKAPWRAPGIDVGAH